MKITLIIIGILILIAAVLSILIKINSKPITGNEVTERIQKLLDNEVEKKDDVSGTVVMIDSPERGFNKIITAGLAAGKPVTSDQPFHIASIGKVFTATLIGTLIDEGTVRLDDSITGYLPPEMVDGLFNIEGTNYSDKVNLGNLLDHTSGVADYFDDPVSNSEPMRKLVLAAPDKFWTPDELLAFSRDFQTPSGRPGELFHYSDTGYILLGLIIENITGKNFHTLLHERIFTPLGMDDSYLMFYSEPVNEKRPISDIWFDGTDVTEYESVSIDWAGGGIISTARDLAIFIRALNNYSVISEETLNSLYSFNNKYMSGIHYGYGFMEYHFEEFFPTLASFPRLRGHMGVLGTQMLYDAATDTVYISSFGSTGYAGGSVRAMIRILGYIMRIEK